MNDQVLLIKKRKLVPNLLALFIQIILSSYNVSRMQIKVGLQYLFEIVQSVLQVVLITVTINYWKMARDQYIFNICYRDISYIILCIMCIIHFQDNFTFAYSK